MVKYGNPQNGVKTLEETIARVRASDERLNKLNRKDIVWIIAYEKQQKGRLSAEEIYNRLLGQIWNCAEMGQMNLITTVGPAVEEMLINDGFNVIRYEGQKYDAPCMISWTR